MGAEVYESSEKPAGRSRAPLWFALAVIVAGFAYLMYGGIAKNLVWNMTPNELLAKGDKAYDHPVRLGGLVVPGTVQWDQDHQGVQFQVRDTTGPVILVRSKAIPSAMFREGIGVVVEGKYTHDGSAAVFHATSLMVKHSNEYKPPAGMKKDDKDEMFNTVIKG